jgi:hypothetical protein
MLGYFSFSAAFTHSPFRVQSNCHAGESPTSQLGQKRKNATLEFFFCFGFNTGYSRWPFRNSLLVDEENLFRAWGLIESTQQPGTLAIVALHYQPKAGLSVGDVSAQKSQGVRLPGVT